MTVPMGRPPMRGELIALRVLLALLIGLALAETFRLLATRTSLWLAAERDLAAAEGELRSAWRAAGGNPGRGGPPTPPDAETPPDCSGGAVGPSLAGDDPGAGEG